jgi:hypothetical protein
MAPGGGQQRGTSTARPTPPTVVGFFWVLPERQALILRSCLVCGRPTQGSRCPDHPRPAARRNQRLRQAVASTAMWCKACSAASTRRWRERNADKLRRPRVSPSKLKCAECGVEFVGRKDRLLCRARRCKDRRYARLHPEALRAKERRKYERRTRRTTECASSRSLTWRGAHCCLPKLRAIGARGSERFRTDEPPPPLA